MKKTVIFIITLITILIFNGCIYQNAATNTSTSKTAVQITETTAPVTTIASTTPSTTITPSEEPNTTTMPDSTIESIIPGSVETPDPKATFTLTKADFEKLKAPLTVLAIENEYNYKFNYDSKNGITRENVADYAWNIAYAFDYFDPSTPRFSEYYNTSIEKYGIKEGDLRQTGIKFYTPKKAINSILLSTFGKAALNGIDLNKDIFDRAEGVTGGLKDGIYITVLYESYPEEDVLGPLDLPIKANENTEFKASYTITYSTKPTEIDNFSITFKLKKDDTSEWGYNITAFNMQEVK